MSWEYPDIAGMLALREAGAAGSATTSANAGPYVVPIGGVLRREIPGYGEHEYRANTSDTLQPLQHANGDLFWPWG